MTEESLATFREATLADAPAIVSVIHDAFEEYRGHLDPPSGAHGETLETVRQKLASAHAIVSSVNGEIVGCAFYELASDYIYLGRLAVLSEHRRQGIGCELIARVEAQARAHGFGRVRLGVRVQLLDNQAYFKRLGYHVHSYGHHSGYTDPTYISMEKDV